MSSKCKTCGYEEDEHPVIKEFFQPVGCEEFVPQSDNLKVTSDEKPNIELVKKLTNEVIDISKKIDNNLKEKKEGCLPPKGGLRPQGCGKMIIREGFATKICGDRIGINKKIGIELCPSCKNQSPQEKKFRKLSSVTCSTPGGTQSPEIPTREKGRSSVKAITLQGNESEDKISSCEKVDFLYEPSGSFNLSDKEQFTILYGKKHFYYPSEDVKTFISQLKRMKPHTWEDMRKEIDKLAGYRLTAQKSKLLKGEIENEK